MITENTYFEGNVKSLGYETQEGKSTIGLINPGEYTFGTAQLEIMHIIEGTLTVLLSNDTEWRTFEKGSHFTVPADSSFSVKTLVQTAYLCQYR